MHHLIISVVLTGLRSFVYLYFIICQSEERKIRLLSVLSRISSKVASLVLGICSLVFGCFFVGLICGIIGLVLANKGLSVCRIDSSYTGQGMLKAGKITSIIGIVLGAIYILYYIVAVLIIGAAGFSVFELL